MNFIRKGSILLMTALLLSAGLLGCGKDNEESKDVNKENISKKAILVASFGTSYPEARKECIESVENTIKDTFPGYKVLRAFTSDFIIDKLKKRDGLLIDNPEQALQKLKNKGYQQVIVQPLHFIPGLEYEELKSAVDKFVSEKAFEKLILGRPLLGSESNPNDFAAVLEALKEQTPELENDQAVVLMGHGSEHPANDRYSKMQQEIDKENLNIIIGTVEAKPTIEDVKVELEKRKINKVILMPFMLVAGDHAQNDLAGNDEDSWKMQLQGQYQVKTYLHGLGENKAVQQIYVQHINDAIKQLNR